ncbi:MAG: sulfite exporter TauE/SafE family protein [Armatimonadetes bacterium]|nr:sulfite exporter TauE/SafE family protein [Armatimonadota bacterium]
MTDPHINPLILILLGAIAAAINSVAGGGSLVSFPALFVGFGLDSKIANATNSVALWPGSATGFWGYREHLGKLKKQLILFLVPTCIGSVLGSYLLVSTTSATFQKVVPWLILIAALAIFLQPRIKGWLDRGEREVHPVTGIVLQFLVSVYGGYFGAGMGIMMLAVFAIALDGTLNELNAVKNALAMVINFFATIVFALSGKVIWIVSLWMILGSLLGGFLGAKYAQRVPDRIARPLIAAYGFFMAGYFFWHG